MRVSKSVIFGGKILLVAWVYPHLQDWQHSQWKSIFWFFDAKNIPRHVKRFGLNYVNIFLCIILLISCNKKLFLKHIFQWYHPLLQLSTLEQIPPLLTNSVSLSDTKASVWSTSTINWYHHHIMLALFHADLVKNNYFLKQILLLIFVKIVNLSLTNVISK